MNQSPFSNVEKGFFDFKKLFWNLLQIINAIPILRSEWRNEEVLS